MSYITPEFSNIYVNVQASPYFATGDGSTDDTAAIQTAIDALEADGAATSKFQTLYFPRGQYLCNNLNWGEGRVTLIGENMNDTELSFNGLIGTDSCVIKTTGTSGSIPYAKIENMTISGWTSRTSVLTGSIDPTASTSVVGVGTLFDTELSVNNSILVSGETRTVATITDDTHLTVTVAFSDNANDTSPEVYQGIAEYCYLSAGAGLSLDFGFALRNIFFRYAMINLLDITNSPIVNLHMQDIRWGSRGGYALAIEIGAGAENRPISILRTTDDNNMFGGAFTTQATVQGYNGTNWSKGVIKLTGVGGASIHISEARWETNISYTLDDTRKAMIHCNTSGIETITLTNIVGNMFAVDAGVMVFDKTGNINLITDSFTSVSNVNVQYEDFAASVYIPKYFGGMSYYQNAQQLQGHYVQGTLVEYRTGVPGAGVFQRYKLGDMVYHSDGEVGEEHLWRVTLPLIGIVSPAGEDLTTDAVVTSGNAVIAVATAAEQYKLMPGHAVTVEGAGVASADLDVVITENDSENGTITISIAPSTSVGAATIKMQTPTFTAHGTI